ncbi:MAG: UDP-N-acetylglucosamine--N-acetylmuramyl-(pentapeptide) pyrophosphoryl-undecaprenol N-acetylglucosamine transferase [Candidatus Spechtbacterales bacterium]
MKILFTGGGTGGHIFPIIAVARAMKDIPEAQGARLLFVGPCHGMKGEFSRVGVRAHNLVTGKLRRYPSFRTLLDVPLLVVGFAQAYWHLLFTMPDIVFSKGGYGAFPVVMVAWLFRIPVIVHESDSVAGATNRLLAHFARVIITSFPGEHPEFPAEKVVRLGNPVRDMRPLRGTKSSGTTKPTIFVIGGSQGAAQINELLFQSLASLTDRYRIVHQVGEKHVREAEEAHIEMPARLRPFYEPCAFLSEEQMREAYAQADLIISRAGSSAIFEIALIGKPSIIIPLSTSAAGHQQRNALHYERAGACIRLDTPIIKPMDLMRAIEEIMGDGARRGKMARAARSFARPNAARDIAQIIIKNGE